MSDTGSEPGSLLQSPLHDRHAALGADFAEFGGWSMPLKYSSGVVKEHTAVREAVGIFDVSHLGKAMVSGPGAAAFVNGMYYEMELGSPGVFTLGVGHDKERGPYALHHLGVKLPFLPRFGPVGFQVNFRFHIFNPRLEPTVARSRPTAEKIQAVSDTMNRYVGKMVARLPIPAKWRKKPPTD